MVTAESGPDNCRDFRRHGNCFLDFLFGRALAVQRNRAIGTILEFERTLPECEALVRTALLLHQNARREVQP